MRVLLVEPFYGGSHRSWADGYAAHSRHEVHLVTHPDRSWRWRLRGGSLTLADDVAAKVAEIGPPAVVVVSDMVDLPALLGFARRSVGDVPVVAYFHENQVLYGSGAGREPDLQAGLVNWLTLAAADLVLFNSAYHRDALVEVLPGFLDRVADERHAHRLDRVVARTEVLPVGVELQGLDPTRRPPDGRGPPLVLWSHRWEWDKQFARALVLLDDLASAGIGFRVALAGEQPDRVPTEIRRGVERLGSRVVHEGHLPRDRYLDLLLRSDVVLSTAKQEFFGIAMVEAMAAGCVPVLPADLSYPEIVPEPWHGAALHERADAGEHLERVLADLPAARAAVQGLAGAMQRFDWTVVAPAYDDRLDRLVASGA